MTRRTGPTTMLDHCGYKPGCPFQCPLVMCVKEYPGGAEGYTKDCLIKALMRENKDFQQIAKIMGVSESYVLKRYNGAHFHDLDPAKAISVNRP